jgi:hypothetical protein
MSKERLTIKVNVEALDMLREVTRSSCEEQAQQVKLIRATKSKQPKAKLDWFERRTADKVPKSVSKIDRERERERRESDECDCINEDVIEKKGCKSEEIGSRSKMLR